MESGARSPHYQFTQDTAKRSIRCADAIYKWAPLSCQLADMRRTKPPSSYYAKRFRSLRRATRALPLTRKLLKKFDQNFYIGAPAAQHVTGAAHFNSHIKMGSGDNIPSEGFGGEQPPLQIHRRVGSADIHFAKAHFRRICNTHISYPFKGT